MGKYRVTTPEGVVEIEADSPEGAARKAHAQFKVAEARGSDNPIPGVGALWKAGDAISLGSPREALAKGLRIAPGLLPGAAGIAGSAVGEAGAQMVEGRSPGDLDWAQVGLAAAVPPAVGLAMRGARALGRTAVRTIPPLFAARQQAAQAALGETMDTLRPAAGAARGLFQAAEQAGAEAIPAGETAKSLASIASTIPGKPASAGLKLVKEHMDTVAGSIQSGVMNLQDLMALRADLTQSLGRAPQIKEMYGGIIRDLEKAAAQGGPGAGALSEALVTFKRDLGVNQLGDLVQKVTVNKAVGEGAQINVPKLTGLVAKNRKELTSLLGEDGMKMVDGFLTRYRTLPPEHAATFANLFIATMAGGAGALGGGLTPAAAIGASLAPEFIRNFWAVGKNPKAYARALTTLVQAARASAVAAESDTPPP